MKLVDFIPITLSVLCFTLAALLAGLNDQAAVGLVGLGGTLAGLAIPQLSSILKKGPTQ